MRRFSAAVLLIFMVSPLCAAETFIMDRYSVSVDIDSARVMHYQEQMDLDFIYPSHGIIRDIQYRFPSSGGYPATRAEVSAIRASEAEDVRRSGDYLSIRLGSSSRMITGKHSFSVSYDFDMGADHYDEYDEVYINIVSADSWNTLIREASYSITLPFPVDRERIWVTSGCYGSTAQVPFSLSSDGLVLSGTVYDLMPGEALTVRIEMDDGYFADAVSPYENASLFFIAGLAVTAAVLVIAFVFYIKYGRDGKPVIPVRFDAPDGLSPMDVSYILNDTVSDDAVGAMLFYWADRGYIEIEEAVRGEMTFRVLSRPDSLSEREAALFDVFFSSDTVDSRTLRMNDFPGKLRRTVIPAVSSFFSGERDLYDAAGRRGRRIVSLLAVLSAVLHAVITALMCGISIIPANFVIAFMVCAASCAVSSRKAQPPVYVFMFFFFAILGTGLYSLLSSMLPAGLAAGETAAFIVPVVLLSFAAPFVRRRSGYGRKTYAEVMGFREYIDKVEKDRIEMLSREDPRYFYHVLSFAMVFGLADRWCSKFSGITVENVSWYRPYGGAGDLLAYAYFSRRWHMLYRSDIMPPRSSGHGGRPTFSGFSGHAGGGFSGGGGRSW